MLLFSVIFDKTEEVDREKFLSKCTELGYSLAFDAGAIHHSMGPFIFYFYKHGDYAYYTSIDKEEGTITLEEFYELELKKVPLTFEDIKERNLTKRSMYVYEQNNKEDLLHISGFNKRIIRTTFALCETDAMNIYTYQDLIDREIYFADDEPCWKTTVE